MNFLQYTEENIKSLDWKEHIRLRPGMYIGKLGDGSSSDDGIYILLKEIIDNSIDEYAMGNGNKILINIAGDIVKVRDYGRGIPLKKVVDAVSKMNTGGKYDVGAFKKSIGLNGVGTKAVNALSSYFKVSSYRDGKCSFAEFSEGNIVDSNDSIVTKEKNGTELEFSPDKKIFQDYLYKSIHVEKLLNNYTYLNRGLKIIYNGNEYFSKDGLKDLLINNTQLDDLLYPIIHLEGDSIEIAISHSHSQYTEDYYSFVNGQYTVQGGTHLAAMKEGIAKTIKEFFNKNYESADIRKSIVAAISIKVVEPVFESQTKTKLGSTDMGDDLPLVRTYINSFIKRELDNFLHQNNEIADIILKKINSSERERKELSSIRKIARERSKKVNLFNKKLRDCKIHLNDLKSNRRLETTLFITEGDSASGSITQSRDPQTQAVFSLKGKPLNSYGMTKKIVYENEEFNLLQACLNIEDSIDHLRYNNVVIATDADVDGMHIRLLIITFFLNFFPDLVKRGHLHILQTPLFRVRNKQKTIYCYSDDEKKEALLKLGKNPEITRFKGLGEISANEFKFFIGNDIRLENISLDSQTRIDKLLEFFMGKNTPERQSFIIDNLKF